MIAFGIQHLVYGKFVTRLVPGLPAWIPSHQLWAYVVGAGLVIGGAAILLNKGARLAASLLGWTGLLSFLLLYIPRLAATPHNAGLWTNAGKALALSGAGFLVAASLKGAKDSLAGRLFLSAFLILAGVQHFFFVQFVAGLVPAWIPGHLFWTYFAGVALIAGGVGMLIPMTTRLAAFLSGIMIFSWVILLHIPRALAAPRNANETTAVFEALAISGAAFLIATISKKGGFARSAKKR
jgi:uncharacterized membrane protein